MVITKNVHPAIVSEEEYELAKATIMFMNKPGYRGTRKFVFKFDDILMRAIEKYQKGEKEA